MVHMRLENARNHPKITFFEKNLVFFFKISFSRYIFSTFQTISSHLGPISGDFFFKVSLKLIFCTFLLFAWGSKMPENHCAITEQWRAPEFWMSSVFYPPRGEVDLKETVYPSIGWSVDGGSVGLSVGQSIGPYLTF